MRLLFLLFLPLVFGLSEYAYLFPPVAHATVLFACKPFDQPVRLTSHISGDVHFKQSLDAARLAVASLDRSFLYAQKQASAWFYYGSNLVTYYQFSVACFAHGQEALDKSLKSVHSAMAVLDRKEADLRPYAFDPKIRALLADLDAADRAIESENPEASVLGSVFLNALNETRHAEKTPLLLAHAVSYLIGPEGFLENIVLFTRKLQGARQDFYDRLESAEKQCDALFFNVEKHRDRLEEEQVYLVPEYAFALSDSRFADSSLSYSFFEKWSRAQILFQEALREKKQAEHLNVSDPARSLDGWLKARALLEESDELLDSVEREVTALEKSLTLALARKPPSLLSERFGKPLPRKTGPRIVELIQRFSLLEKPTPVESAPWQALYGEVSDREKKGVDLSFEKAQLSEIRENPDAKTLQDVREKLDAKIRERFGPLESRIQALEPYAGVLDLPSELFQKSALTLSETASAAELERQVAAAEKTVASKASAAVLRSFQDSLSLETVYPAAAPDQQVDVAVQIDLENPHPFPVQNLLFPIPAVVEDAVLQSPFEGVRSVEGGLLFSHVLSQTKYRLSFIRREIPVKMTHLADQEVYTDFSISRRRLTATFQSAAELIVLLDLAVLGEPSDSKASHDFWYDGRVKTSIPSRKGSNTFVLDYSILQPVRFHQVSNNQTVTYFFENRLSVPLEKFSAQSVESYACAPVASFIRPLSGTAFQLDFSFGLQPLEKKTLTASVTCPVVSSTMASSPTPEPYPLTLEQSKRWAYSYPEAREWLRQAESAFLRKDVAAENEAIAEMGNFEKRLVQSFEAQADALCGRCSAQVREPVMNALSAVFVRDFSRADEKLVQARAIFESEKKAAQEKETSAQELEKQKAELSFAELDLFEKAFAGVSMKGDPERLSLDQTRTSAKKRFDRLKGQNLAQDKFQAERSLFQDERKILSDAVASVRESASLTLESARKAQTQFGDDSSQRALHAIEASFSEGRFSAAQEAASRLIAQMQKTQPVQKTGLFSGNATEWLIGVFAFFALAGLVYYFRFRNAPVKLEEI